jgi:small subunit ribosomal protein S9
LGGADDESDHAYVDEYTYDDEYGEEEEECGEEEEEAEDEDDSADKDREGLYSEEDDDDDENFYEMEEAMAQLYQRQKEWEANKERWLRNSISPERFPVIDPVGRAYGRGGRKTAEARVWVTPGFGNVTVNRQDFVEYFPRRSDREQVLDPLVATQTAGKFDLQCIVKGGGLTGQAGAIRLGVARALQHWNPEYRPAMKKMGYLTRDSRKVERKKIGRVKARKSPQWNRR